MKKQATEGGKPAAAGEFKGQNSPTRGGVTETQRVRFVISNINSLYH